MKPLVLSRARKRASRSLIVLLSILLISQALPARAIDPTVRIAIAYDLGGLGDGGVNDAAAIGLKAARAKFGLSPLSLREVVTLGTESDRIERLSFLAKAGYNLVIAVGSAWTSSLTKVATDYPEVQFANIGGSEIGMVNVSVMAYSHKEESYLAGVVAAAASSSKKIGYVADSADDKFTENLNAFIAGAKYGNPAVKINSASVSSSAVAQVKSLVASGIDLIYSRRSSSADVYSTVLGLSKSKKIKFIGVYPDQYFLGSAAAQKILLATLVEDYGVAVNQLVAAALDNQTITDIVDGTDGNFGRLYTLKNRGLSVRANQLTSATMARLTSAKNLLLQGKVKL